MVCQHLLSLIHETLGAHCPSSSRLVIMGVGSQQRAGRRKKERVAKEKLSKRTMTSTEAVKGKGKN